MKSFRPKDEPPEDGDGNGWSDSAARSAATRRTNRRRIPTVGWHEKGHGQEAKLAYCGNLLMANRNDLVVDVDTAHATGRAEREGVIRMLKRQKTETRRWTLGADKGYDTKIS